MTTLPLLSQPIAADPLGAAIAIIDEMDVAVNTRIQYRREIRVFLAWLSGQTIQLNTLLRFKQHLQSRTDIAAGTKAKYLTVARRFLRELYRLQLIPVDITVNVKGIAQSRMHKRSPITEKEVGRMFAYLRGNAADPRALVIIGLMYFQGLRRVEIQRLKVEDYDRQSRTLAVIGKGKVDHERIDLHPAMAEILEQFLSDNNRKSGPILPSPSASERSLSSSAIWRIGMRAHDATGLSTKNLHGWRKTFTTRLIRSGLNLLEVQGYTRHASVEMLQVYYQRIEREKTLPIYYQALGGV